MDMPAGFEPHFRRSGLTDPWEPLYSRQADDAIRIALRAAEAHANSRGFVHGGLISALADNAMGLSCIFKRGKDLGSLVTISLSVDFISTARLGQWVEIRPTVLKAGRGATCFASAVVMADETVCARASATFRAVSA